MSTNSSQPNQDLEIGDTNIFDSFIAQAGRDIYQVRGDFHQNIKIFLSSSSDVDKNKIFIEDNFNKLSFLERPLQFFKVLIFLIKVLIFWLFIWWKVDYQLPIDLAWDLIKASWRGELTQSINSLYQNSNLKFSHFIDNPNSFSLEEKIALEAQIKLCFDLIQNLASSESSDRQERISDFLFENRFKLSWFSDQIKRDKIKNYKKLYNLQSKASKRNKSKEIVETYVGYIIFLLSTCSPSPDIIGELIQKTDAFIDLNKKRLSANNLTTLKNLKRVLRLITQKFTIDPSDGSGSLQKKYHSLLEEKHRREQQYRSVLKKKSDLENEIVILENRNASSLQRIDDIQHSYNDLENSLKSQQRDNDLLRQGIQGLKAERNDAIAKQQALVMHINQLNAQKSQLIQERLEMQENPVSYLIRQGRIEKYIANKKYDVYHHHPACPYWQSFIFRYLMDRRYNTSAPSSDFIVSSSTQSFLGMNECSTCQKNSAKK